MKKTDFRLNAFWFPGSNFMFYFPPRGQHIFYVIFPYSRISLRLFSTAAPHPLWYILRAQCLLPALPVDLRPLVWPIGAVLHFPINTDHSLYSACPPSSMAMWQEPWQTDRQPGARSQALGPTASAAQPIAQGAAHGLPADKWADKPSPRYSFPSWGKYGEEKK